MDATDVPAKKDSSWRSFAIFGVGLLTVAAAFFNLVSSEGGSGAFRLLLISFLVLVVSLLVGLVIDWRRLDWLTRVVQTLALVGCVVMLVGVGIIFPDVLRMMWES
jgi:hypothetical protein